MPKKCCNQVVLRDRCDIQQDSSTTTDVNENFAGAAYAANIHCEIKTVGGDETYRGRQLQAGISHVVEMRYRAGVTAKMRLLIRTGIYKDRILNIKVPRPIQKPGTPPMLELYCEELAVV